MQRADVVVIGGSAAGLTAAITARRHHRERDVLVIRKEARVPIPCGIPYIFGTVGSPDRNLIPDGVLDKKRLRLLQAEATGIDCANAVVETRAGSVQYDRLVIATGSSPAVPPIPGVDLDGIFTIRKDVDYLTQLQERVATARNVVVVGGGFIGVELADEINKLDGKTVTVVELQEHCLSLAYDEELCQEMEGHVRARGVNLRTGIGVSRFGGDGSVQTVVLANGEELEADLVVLGIGAQANAKLATSAGLRTGATGAVAVDRTMKTSDDRVFACGDCAEKISFFGGGPSQLKLASIATHEARIVGANLYGVRRENVGTVGVWSTAVGDLALGTAGLTETQARALGYDVIAVTVDGPNRHPDVMPGMARTLVKAVFERKSGVLLGGQVRGDATVGELVNTIAACVQRRMTADAIAMLQVGTHPALTASPIAHPLANVGELAISRM